MTRDGCFTHTLPVSPLKRISPSRFNSLNECSLREIWQGNKQRPLLPSNVASSIGSAIHELFDKIGKREFIFTSAEDVNDYFENVIRKFEADQAKTWFTRHLLPFRDHLRDFEVRKIRAVKRAIELAESGKQLNFTSKTSAKNQKSPFEHWVQSKDGKIGGFIDQISSESDGIVLRDFKSGTHITLENGDVLPEYKTQMGLYGYLFYENYGEWPARLELVSLTGVYIPVKIDHAECKNIYDNSKKIFDRLNATITKVDTNSLANTGSHCRYCPYRPSCMKYLGEVFEGKLESADLYGTVNETIKLGNGQRALTIQMRDRMYMLKGLNPDIKRHPALAHLASMSKVGAFNLSGSGYVQRSESDYTTIYFYP